MNATSIIALYAALMATAGLGWQIYSWWHRRQNRVKVDLSLVIVAPAPGHTVQGIGIRAINRSEHPIRVTGVGLDFQDERPETFQQVQQLYGADLPGLVQPHDSATALILREDAEREGINLYEPLVAWVRLATGEVLKSSPTQVLAES